MSRAVKALIFGLITALAGAVMGIFPLGVSLEEGTGLTILFKLRGERKPPPEVVIVGIDKRSSDSLGLKNDPKKWPRTLHAELIEKAMAAGASGIVFDMFFEEPKPGREDAVFSAAVKKSGRVILCQRLMAEKSDAKDGTALYTEKLVSPLPMLEEGALALAPFPMPKVALSVIRNWMFKTEAGDAPTLPIVSYQLFASDLYEDFLDLLTQSGTRLPADLPKSRADLLKHGALVHAIQEIRAAFEKESDLETRIIRLLDRSQKDNKEKARIRSLINMYAGDSRKYLNFYGPLGSIRTIPYDQMLGRTKIGMGTAPELKGKMVFVGFSELYQPEQKDTFFTVFSQEDGRDISGIELAATEFANLLENMPVSPLNFSAYIALIFFWGFVIGMVCKLLSPVASGAAAVISAGMYAAFAFWQFRTSGIWYPVMIPVFVQPVFAFVGSMLWKYAAVNRERRNIRHAFGYYLPGEIVDKLAKDMSGIKTESKSVHGICLYTDAEGYTSFAESTDSHKVSQHMNRYYEIVFGPIKKNSGTISNVVGDSVLALWLGTEADRNIASKACNSALEISSRMQELETMAEGFHLPTRIGLHAGQIMLGNIGAADHFEYRPVGDIVNTTTRLDGINKLLSTRILISDNMAMGLEGFVTRDVGTFLVKGKTIPIKIHELICSNEKATPYIYDSCKAFADALSLFREGDWEAAGRGFSDYRQRFGGDGPALFYHAICSRYIDNPPADAWDGVIRMDYK